MIFSALLSAPLRVGITKLSVVLPLVPAVTVGGRLTGPMLTITIRSRPVPPRRTVSPGCGNRFEMLARTMVSGVADEMLPLSLGVDVAVESAPPQALSRVALHMAMHNAVRACGICLVMVCLTIWHLACNDEK